MHIIFLLFLCKAVYSIQFSDYGNCTTKIDGESCGFALSNKVCQDNICICKEYNYFFCTSCGKPNHEDFYEHDDYVSSIDLSYVVSYDKTVYESLLHINRENIVLNNNSITLMNDKLNTIMFQQND